MAAKRMNKGEMAVAAAMARMRDEGAMLVVMSDAMGRAVYKMQAADGSQQDMPRMVGQMMPLGQMVAVESSRNKQVYKAR